MFFELLFNSLLILTSQSFGASLSNSVVECSSSKYCFNSIDLFNAMRGCPGKEVLSPSDRRILTFCGTAAPGFSCLLSSISDEKGISITIRKASIINALYRHSETASAVVNALLYCDEQGSKLWLQRKWACVGKGWELGLRGRHA